MHVGSLDCIHLKTLQTWITGTLMRLTRASRSLACAYPHLISAASRPEKESLEKLRNDVEARWA